jgi:hypothetical protein
MLFMSWMRGVYYVALWPILLPLHLATYHPPTATARQYEKAHWTVWFKRLSRDRPFREADPGECCAWGAWILILYLGLSVFLRWISIVLDVLRESLSAYNEWAVMGILLTRGVIVYLFPPTNGFPLYIVAGCVLPQRFAHDPDRPSFQDGGIWTGVAFALALCQLMKGIACYIQQEVLGKSFGHNQKVRRLVGVHTILIRATEGLLKEKSGLNGFLFKLVMFTAMPDWPMSVLCGILNMPTLSTIAITLVGDLFLSALCITTGLLQWMACPATVEGECVPRNENYEAAAAVSVVVFTIFMNGIVFVAMAFIAKEISNPRHRVVRLEDASLIALDEASEARAEYIRVHVMAWHKLSCWGRASRMAAFLLCYLSVWLDYMCASAHDYAAENRSTLMHIGVELLPSPAHARVLAWGLGLLGIALLKVVERLVLRFSDRGDDDGILVKGARS